MSTTAEQDARTTAAPVVAFVRDQIPGLLGIADGPLMPVYEALIATMSAGEVFDGLHVSDARSVAQTLAQVTILDSPPRSAAEAAAVIARCALAAFTDTVHVDTQAVGQAYLKAVIALLR